MDSTHSTSSNHTNQSPLRGKVPPSADTAGTDNGGRLMPAAAKTPRAKKAPAATAASTAHRPYVEPPVRVAIYMRGSTGEGNQPYTLDAQRADIDGFLAGRPTWSITAEYVERVSGKNVTDRAEMQKLLRDATGDTFDLVLVAKLDRWGRNTIDVLSTVRHLRDHGVAFHSVMEPHVSTQGPSGYLVLSLLATFAEFEHQMIIDRILKGNAAKIARGLPLNSRVGYGLRTNKDGVIEADPSTFGIVQRIFTDYTTQRVGTRAIAANLNEAGIASPGKSGWTQSNVGDILRNHAYVGQVQHKGHWFKGAHEPLIDPVVFAVAQEIADERAESASTVASHDSDYLLTGVITCGHCQGAYVGSTGTSKTGAKHRYYVCRKARARGKAACPAPNVPADDLETLMRQSLVDAYADTELFEAAVERFLAEHAETVDPNVAELEAVRGERAKKARIRKRYQDDYEEGDLDARTYRARANELDDDLAALDSRIRILETATAVPATPAVPTEAELAQMRATLTGALTEETTPAVKAVFQAFVEGVEVHALDDIRPTLRIMDAQTISALRDETASGTKKTGGREEFASRRSRWS